MSDPDFSAAKWAHSPHVQIALKEWQRIFLQRDWDALPELLADDVTFHTPADAMPLRGKDAFVASLRQSFGIFESFEYARKFVGDDGHVLEFRGSVGDAAFTGIDIIRLDGAGKVTDLVVMIRPIAAVMKLGEEAARHMATANQTYQD
ncbi:MAG: nuclear transport factor 2 family protein [Rhodospirillales bacterium]|nr:nuclear transport factor 2 family protein [Rhodospirillales bacterium]